jgi:hypothetical protein
MMMMIMAPELMTQGTPFPWQNVCYGHAERGELRPVLIFSLVQAWTDSNVICCDRDFFKTKLDCESKFLTRL